MFSIRIAATSTFIYVVRQINEPQMHQCSILCDIHYSPTHT